MIESQQISVEGFRAGGTYGALERYGRLCLPFLYILVRLFFSVAVCVHLLLHRMKKEVQSLEVKMGRWMFKRRCT